MSESFDIASLGPEWQPYKATTPLTRSHRLALRVPTEVGTRTIVGFFESMDGAQVTVELKSGARLTYSAKNIVAVVYRYQQQVIR